MIRVKGLTRRYGGVTAVDRVDFDVPEGQVVGFLGPNGAGKSTTMRMLVGLLAPSSGRAAVAGHDVVADSLAARACIGYVPEVVPLYPEMTVGDYLRHMARLRRLPDPGERAEATAALCRLSDRLRTHIWKLSHGYRQRVGLAQALIHDPPVLILDEPTTGLDPLQIVEFRELIRGLGGRHTVLLSTHILAEAEQVCRRVLIIDKGRLIGDCSLDDAGRDTVLSLRLESPGLDAAALLAAVPGVAGAEAVAGDPGRYRIRCLPAAHPEPEIAALALARGWGLRALAPSRTELEELFVRAVTGQEQAE